MVTLSECCEVIQQVTMHPMPDITIRARRLREAGLLPQGGRGIHAAHLDAKHIAYLLIGVMAYPVGPVVKVERNTSKIYKLKSPGSLILSPSKRENEWIEVSPKGSFLNGIATLLECYQHPDWKDFVSGSVQQIGITISQNNHFAWIKVPQEYIRDASNLEITSDGTKVIFGNWQITKGMECTVTLNSPDILRISNLLKTQESDK